jgi:hypothetical protein
MGTVMSTTGETPQKVAAVMRSTFEVKSPLSSRSKHGKGTVHAIDNDVVVEALEVVATALPVSMRMAALAATLTRPTLNLLMMPPNEG